ncbi:MAG: 2-oxoacid:ferredoxin oxidoreductase subunit beta [Deltaproteobacteria bacterium]|nr:2-oxoacid:ferredoxin oxidoreductase subunit beta [Deltaproteobacteria bacterium]
MVTVADNSQVKLTRKDFQSSQEVRWCPGCGDYAILATVQRFLPSLGIPKENIVFISGIGCSSRFPYYMSTYGFHTIHGRAPAIASGVKIANPKLNVWVVTGDGDSLSIGGNHLIHALRRNVNLKILLFNNRIYGLTKGQYSPTSEAGKKTKSSPFGSVDHPFSPASVALGAEATFVARSIDRDAKHLEEMLAQLAAHEGSGLLEIFQNCNVFNDGAYVHFTEKDVKDSMQLRVEHGKPFLFANGTKGIRFGGARGFDPEIVTVGEGGVPLSEVAVHDETEATGALAFMLSKVQPPTFPMPIGVFRKVQRPVYEEQVHAQIAQVTKARGEGTIRQLLTSGETWRVD